MKGEESECCETDLTERYSLPYTLSLFLCNEVANVSFGRFCLANVRGVMGMVMGEWDRDEEMEWSERCRFKGELGCVGERRGILKNSPFLAQ